MSKSQDSDVVVVGSGGAALTCAIAAADAGARVAVLEKSAKIGGTTAMSGGLVWIPNNHHMLAEGTEDSEADAIRYLERLAAGRRGSEMVRAVVEAGPAMVRALESTTTLAFETLEKPDYHPELPGARSAGRCLAPNLIELQVLGAWREQVLSGPYYSLPMTWREFDATNAVFRPERLDLSLIEERAERGIAGMGAALIGHLLAACLARRIPIETETRAVRLVSEQGRVCGVVARGSDGEEILFDAARAVVLACGGFEWNPELVRRFTAGPMDHPIGNPYNEGDGLLMAMAVGADLANMDDLLRFPASSVPGETFEGRPLHRMIGGERALPHTIMVNRRGHRFVNEAHNYTDVARAFAQWDPVAYDYANHPAWAVFDQQFRERYTALGIAPEEPTPDWLAHADSLAQLAEHLGIDALGLTETVERFNSFVAAGVDPDFQRGESYFDTYYADAEREPSATLGSIEKPPFYALPVYCGAIGSSGGPRTNPRGQIVHVSGRAIPGLYAVGDAAASPFGPGYGGPGGPLGHGLTMGYLAGRHAASAITEED